MIDRLTVERIKETANIVDVVGEFVTLRKSGINYKGLCPFHNEKTPSFFVSPTRGTCHCFGCGRGGNSVTFIMEHEQMTYPEALRWLAKKYNIEIQERELSEEEKREQSERESMFIINEWASGYFEDLLHNHPDGQAVGLQYFRQRGFRDDIIKKFRLGFDLPDRYRLAPTAREAGYNTDFLLKTGLCYQNDRGELIDRYAGRVMFPWIGVSGKTVGFGGRLLDSRTKGVAQKYVNSPESDIYHKDKQLYGIFQAKKAIAKEDCVYMVEGYTDVLSMHQCGIENVVANSGTALSQHQIQMLHRFTSNIVLLYDGDEAGIHAALRGTDMLLSEGMNVKVLLFPDGDDPDSFARKHSAEAFKTYIEENKTDFIRFKTKLLLDGVTDPAQRAEAINAIVKSISLVPNPILRDTYLHECTGKVGVNEVTLVNTMNKLIRESKESTASPQQPQEAASASSSHSSPVTGTASKVEKVEVMLAQMIIRHGEKVILPEVEAEDGSIISLNVAQFIQYSFQDDGLSFRYEPFNRILQEAVEQSARPDFVAETYFMHHNDIELAQLATRVGIDKYQLLLAQKGGNEPLPPADAKTKEEEAREALKIQTMHLIMDFQMDYLERKLDTLKADIAASANDSERMLQLMTEFKEVQNLRNILAQKLGVQVRA